jgi:dienelactone hydrolase
MEAPGLESLDPVPLDPSWIARLEVTNAEYAEFVDAGGYGDERYWTEPFEEEGRVLSFTEGIARLVDQSGLPGPSSWVGGEYPEGTADHPVGGVSWYEAVAYANYAGKRLPSVYHWNRAAGTGASSLIVPASNLQSNGPQAVGETSALSRSGARDMAGNVREWCWNASGENRFIMGGGWSDAPYMFADAYSQPAWDRSAINGIRLAMYEDSENLHLALQDVPRPSRDFYAEEPISDERFAAYRSLFAYDPTPLNVTVESSDSSHRDWVREHVSFDAAYDGPRMEAVVFLPKDVEPPYQTVVYFPGSGALFIDDTDAIQGTPLDFVVRTGRAVVIPIYHGTYGRGGNELLDTDQPNQTVAYRDVVVEWAKDLGRSLDYLETRPDVDADRLAFYGISWGARMGVLMVALEERFQAAILFVGGLKLQPALPEADPATYARRVTLPVLMLNGRYDHFFPLETSQIPLYELLGTPEEDKQHLVFDGWHDVPEPIRIRESLAWLDRYLGPVR